MMIMEGGKMFKTEYDLKAIMYSAYNTPHKVHNIPMLVYRHGRCKSPHITLQGLILLTRINPHFAK